MIEVYPKIIVFCPKENKEINGNLCVNCENYQGISYNEADNGRFYIRCFYKKEAEAGKSE